MTTDETLLAQVERSQRQRTHRRRDGRIKRRRLLFLLVTIAIIGLIAGAPSLVSHSGLGTSMLASQLADYGLTGQAQRLRIGWTTPLQVSALAIRGESGTRLSVEQLDIDVTVLDLLRGDSNSSELRHCVLRNVALECVVDNGITSVEADLENLINSDEESKTSCDIELNDVSIAFIDGTTGDRWQLSQGNGQVQIDPSRTEAVFSGVLVEPDGNGGSMQGTAEFVLNPVGPTLDHWKVDVQGESLPLSVARLLRRRVQSLADFMPTSISGDATGSIALSGRRDGTIDAVIDQLRIRNVSASIRDSRTWHNTLASIDGELTFTGNRILGRRLRAETDFASITIDAAFSRQFSLIGADDNPVQWLDAIDGAATAQIDLAAFNRALPGLIPLRPDAEIISGVVFASVQSQDAVVDGGSVVRSCQLTMRSEALRTQTGGRQMVIDPIEVNTIVKRQGNHLRAERFECKSMFGEAVGQGDLRQGSADFNIDFGRFMTMIQPLIQTDRTMLAGSARGTVRWNASADNIWQLAGTSDASNLNLITADGKQLQQSSMHAEIDAVGKWGSHSLDELSSVRLSLTSDGLEMVGQLQQAVSRPTASTPMPVTLHAQGRIEPIAEMLNPWIPRDCQRLSGSFVIDTSANVSTESVTLGPTNIVLDRPHVAWGQRRFSQPRVRIAFEGTYRWPEHNATIDDLTLEATALTLRTRGVIDQWGHSGAEKIELKTKWRADLERLQGSVHEGIAAMADAVVHPAGFQPSDGANPTQWWVTGNCQGSVNVKADSQTLDIQVIADGTDIAIAQPAEANPRLQMVGPQPPGSSQAGRNAGRVVWAEPNVHVNGWIRHDRQQGHWQADAMQIAGDWFATTLTGPVRWSTPLREVRLDGPARFKMNEVASRVAALTNVQVQADGIQETMLEIQIQQRENESAAISIRGNLGWESAQVAGLTLGPSSIPVRMTETSIEIAPSQIPVGQGRLRVSGQAHYRPGTPWFRVAPGSSAESIHLTPDITDRWLKYLAPLVADATRIEGTIGLEIDESVIVLDQPQQTRVRGRLRISQARMSPGPLANQVLIGIAQLRAIQQTVAGQVPGTTPTTLISMPAQTVEFTVEQGVVTHDRMFFEIDRAQIVTSGQVGLDGRLSMIAQIPLDARWLGRDLQGLAGQYVALPIDGTLTNPSLDSAAIRRIVSEFGAQTIQNAAENYLQQQLNRGLEKLLGR